MAEFLVVMLASVILGLVTGTWILISQENPKIKQFVEQRPVLGCSLAFLLGGIAFYLLLVAAMDIVLGVIGFLL